MGPEAEVDRAVIDYRRGEFGLSWEHTLSDDEWARRCDERQAERGRTGGVDEDGVLSPFP